MWRGTNFGNDIAKNKKIKNRIVAIELAKVEDYKNEKKKTKLWQE